MRLGFGEDTAFDQDVSAAMQTAPQGFGPLIVGCIVDGTSRA